MRAKIIAFGASRKEARRKLVLALEKTVFAGPAQHSVVVDRAFGGRGVLQRRDDALARYPNRYASTKPLQRDRRLP